MSTTTKSKTLTTQEVANRLTSLCREGKYLDAVDELYHDNIVSHEPKGARSPERLEGKKNVRGKTEGWMAAAEKIHDNKVSEPLVAGDRFAVKFSSDVTMKEMGRFQMDEIAVYKVTDGKVVEDSFHYPTQMN